MFADLFAVKGADDVLCMELTVFNMEPALKQIVLMEFSAQNTCRWKRSHNKQLSFARSLSLSAILSPFT